MQESCQSDGTSSSLSVSDAKAAELICFEFFFSENTVHEELGMPPT